MNVIDAKATALALLAKHGLTTQGWRFEYDHSSRRFGCCKHGQKVISLAYKLVALNDEEAVRDTILHEIAHALCPAREGHGARWRAKAREIGAKPERCYKSSEVEAPRAPFEGRCPCGLVVVRRHRRLPADRVCRRCRKPLSWKRN